MLAVEQRSWDFVINILSPLKYNTEMSSLYAFFQIHSGHSPHSITSYFIEATMSWAAEVASLSRLRTKGNRI